MTTEELIQNALNTIGPNSVPESAGMVYGLIAIAQELKRANDNADIAAEQSELFKIWKQENNW